MMLFKEKHIPLIEKGIKKRSRRIWIHGARVLLGSRQQVKKEIFTKEFFGKIHITILRQEHLLDITEKEAKLEGNYTVESYLREWDEINSESIKEHPEYASKNNPLIWVVGWE